MKKIFSFVFAVALTTSLWATQYIVQPTSEGNIRQAIRGEGAATGAQSGDTLLLVTGEYSENQSMTINAVPNVVVMAAEGEKPVIKQSSYFKVYKNATFVGIIFDGGSTAFNTFYIYDADVQKLTLLNCEFTGFTSYNITGSSSTTHAGEVYIDGCFFYNNATSAAYFPASSQANNVPSCDKLTVKNTTACNITNCDGCAVFDIRNNKNDYTGTATTLVADHLTIYNYTASNGAVMSYKSGNASVTNSIFSNPTSGQYASYLYAGGAVTNCIRYNTKKHDGPTFTNVITSDPLFVDPANLDFTLAEGSPAIGADTQGNNLGDPRWTPKEIPAIDLPATLNKANKYAKSAAMPYYQDAYFDFGPNDSSNDTAFWATWVVNVEKGKYAVEADLTSSNDYKLQLEFINASTDVLEKTILADKSTATFDVDLNDLDGKYYLRLKNRVAWSKVKVKSLTFTYKGGAVKDIPGTLLPADAMLTGSKMSITAEGIKWDDVSAPADNYAVWNVNATKAGNFEVEINVASAEADHTFTVSLYNGETLISSVAETKTSQSGIFNLGNLEIPAKGNYQIRVDNTTKWTTATLASVKLTYAGGAIIDLPGSLLPDDAKLTGEAISITADGILWNDVYAPADNYATWKVNAAKSGNYNVKINVASATASHTFVVGLYDGATLVASVAEAKTSKSGIFDLGNIALDEAGEYTVRVDNTTQWTTATLASVTFAYKGGALVDLPATLLPVDAFLSDEAFVDKDSILFTPRGSEGYNYRNWAKWNVNVTEKAKYNFKANVKSVNGYRFAIEVLDANNESVYTYSADSLWDGGQDALNLGNTILEEGIYTVKMQNIFNYSEGRLMSVNITKESFPAVTISEEAQDNSVLTANEGKLVKATLTRSLTAGMFNTLCLPFALSAEQIAESDLAGARIIELTSTSLEDQKLYLNYTEVDAIEAGKGYLIEPAAAVENPVFNGVTITKTAATEETVDAVKVIPTFIVSSIPASTANLYLYLDNTLYYAGQETTIKGMRLYYNVSGTLAPARMRIGSKNTPTTLDEVEQVMVVDGKFIQDGKMYIMKNGVVYNAQGQIVK